MRLGRAQSRVWGEVASAAHVSIGSSMRRPTSIVQAQAVRRALFSWPHPKDNRRHPARLAQDGAVPRPASGVPAYPRAGDLNESTNIPDGGRCGNCRLTATGVGESQGPVGQPPAGGGQAGGRGGGRGRGGPANVSARMARIAIMSLNHSSIIKLPWQEATPERTLSVFDLPKSYVDVYGVRNVEFQSNHVAQDDDAPDLAYIKELRARLDAAGSKANRIDVEIGTMAQMGPDSKAAAPAATPARPGSRARRNGSTSHRPSA